MASRLRGRLSRRERLHQSWLRWKGRLRPASGLRTSMSDDFSVHVDGIRFASAHFATYRGKCEPLHGHSYQVEAHVEGALTEDSWVIDFHEIKALLRQASAEIDHKFILQRKSRLLAIEEVEGGWRVRTPAGLEYVFPANDVAAL